MKNATIFKVFSIMLAVLIIAAAIGCGKGGEQKATPAPTATVSPTATTPAGQSGTLSDIAGDVQVKSAGSSAWSAASNGMKIWKGDGLKTGSNGYVIITFFDGSVMEVNPGTEISVEELSQAAGGTTTVKINQTIGNTLNRVQNLVDSSSTYEVTTPAGSAVVRGTIYSVDVTNGGARTTCVTTIDEYDTVEHSVAFSNGGKTVNVIENFMSCSVEGGVPQTPTYADPTNDPGTYESGGGGSQPQPSPTPQPQCGGEIYGYCAQQGFRCCDMTEGLFECLETEVCPECDYPCTGISYCQERWDCMYCDCIDNCCVESQDP